jgi:3D (Asp-Asp-Asp) domain-containing protein
MTTLHRCLFLLALSGAVAACSSVATDDDGDVAADEGALTFTLAEGSQAVTTSRVRLREGPSTDYDAIQILPINTLVTILRGPDDDFYGVLTSGGASGYVHGAYLQPAGDAGAADGGRTLPTGGGSTAFPTGGDIFQARGTGYFPDSSSMEGGFNDMREQRLRTLQGFLSGRDEYVSVAMDANAFRYGQKLRIKELEDKYGRQIEFRVVDTGGAFKGKGRTRIDICTANSSAAGDATINRTLTLAVVN